MGKHSAVSPISAVMILIGISLVGGALFHGMYTQVLLTSFEDIDYLITDLAIQKDSSSGCYFLATITNTGTLLISNATISTTLDSNNKWVLSIIDAPIEPQSSTTMKEFFNDSTQGLPCLNFTSGNTYSVQINATGDTSSTSKLIPITIETVGSI